jgi:predicted Zn-dependent protease
MRLAFILSLWVLAGSVWAADTSPAATPAPRDPALERFASARDRQDWPAAAAAMQEALRRDAQNADYHNLYAYALRKGGSPDMNLVFKHYNEALRIDRKHRGAHEYIGEAYLMVGNVAKAKEHLAELDRLCFFGCSEFADLKKAITEYETKTAKR